jgi:GntR family transcriptional regulator
MLEFDNNLPIYLQICEYIKDMIYKGQLKPGDLAPSIRKLAIEINVNPNTVARSYIELEREGIIRSSRGMASTVTTDLERIRLLKKEKIRSTIEGVYLQLVKLGLNKADIKDEINNYLNEWKDKE